MQGEQLQGIQSPDLNLQYVKDPQTIDSHLSGKVTTGDEKRSQRILTETGEKSLVLYLITRNRGCQRVECRTGKGGCTQYIAGKGPTFQERWQWQHFKQMAKVSAKGGLRCTKQMTIDYIDGLASQLIKTDIASGLVKARGQ